MRFLDHLQHWLEYLGGARETPPVKWPHRFDWLITGVWWAVLVCLIAVFSGQSSKFIYIDF